MTATAVPLRRGWHETVTIVLLLIGGFLGGIGWLVGVILLWLSQVWTTRDKVIGTLIVPGGLVLPATLTVLAMETTTASTAGTHWWRTALFIAATLVLALASIGSAVYLARRSSP